MLDPRWRLVLTVTPYIVLGMLTVFALGAEWGAWSHLVPTLVLCVVAVVWILVFRTLLPSRDRPAAIAVFLSGFIVINLVLVLRDSWFGFLTIATFSFAYSLVRWPWQLLAVGATAVVAGLAQSKDLRTSPATAPWALAVIALNIIVMCGLAWGLRVAQQQQGRMSTELERSRLAREIHDTLAQGFVGIVTQLQAAEQAPGEAERRRHADAALALAREGLAEARRSVQALRPAPLDEVRLAGALRGLAERWSGRTGIPVEVTSSGDALRVSTDAEIALLRTAQEALANVERHAAARHVGLTLATDAHGTRLEVRDDGRGFDPEASVPAGAEGGFGLVAMRERVEALAGTLVVDSRPGHGTAVRAEMPR
ncbi:MULTISPECIES: sensor histidine kinase [unclassified Microbacterium]|mgnify:CR=1 FL=1|uniref:sensor histidine kinase n=1 Tax=unclassified Microbacterium TaxID=2609290 RepID=UPI000A6B1A9B|nr:MULTISPECIES: sensor histidine kinase [unclassified Microbacterium]MBN9193514.1 sensor histidine kinase [Microbacterium sp.]